MPSGVSLRMQLEAAMVLQLRDLCLQTSVLHLQTSLFSLRPCRSSSVRFSWKRLFYLYRAVPSALCAQNPPPKAKPQIVLAKAL